MYSFCQVFSVIGKLFSLYLVLTRNGSPSIIIFAVCSSLVGFRKLNLVQSFTDRSNSVLVLVRERSHTPVKSLAAREPSTPVDLISNATKQSFHHHQPSPPGNHTPDIPVSSRTSKNNDQYGSNPR